MKELSHIAQSVRASTTMSIDAMFKQMKADGIDAIGFGVGEPDFDTPENIKRAGIDAIEKNHTRYTAAAGSPELRQAICRRLALDCRVSYKPNQILVASGAKHALYIALCALINPGDEVLLPAPYWVSYYELIRMVGGVPVIVTAEEKDGFKLTAEQLKAAVTPKTKAMILNNPSNPTGMVYGQQELARIAEVCLSNEIYVVADEIYYGLIYDGIPFTSFASLGEEIKDLTILINGVSKSYAMTGWRIGYAAANDQIAAVMANFISHSTGCPCSISQKASLEALSADQSQVEEMRKAFERRRNEMVEHMNAIKGVSCLKPEGAFYIMMNLNQLIGKTLHGVEIRNSDDFAELFLEKGLVAVVPCTGFGAPDFVRWSYATSLENIHAGLDRLEDFLKGQI